MPFCVRRGQTDPRDLRGGQQSKGSSSAWWCRLRGDAVVVAGQIPDTSRAYRLDAARVQSLVGMTIPESDQRQTLTSLGFRLEGNMAHVPTWRPDVQGEADLVEEVARIASLTKLEGRPLPRLSAGEAPSFFSQGSVGVAQFLFKTPSALRAFSATAPVSLPKTAFGLPGFFPRRLLASPGQFLFKTSFALPGRD